MLHQQGSNGSRTESKILLLTYKALKDQDLKNLQISPDFPTELHSQSADLLVVPGGSKSRIGGRAISYDNPHGGTSSQLGFSNQILTLPLRLELKLAFLIELIGKGDLVSLFPISTKGFNSVQDSLAWLGSVNPDLHCMSQEAK